MSAPGQDPRVAAAEMQNETMNTVFGCTTQSLVDAANRLVDELPVTATPEEVGGHMMASAIRQDAERGVIWPTFEPDYFVRIGHDWHLFPNLVILPGPTFALVYRARPNGNDPNSCIFEVSALERYPEGKEPKTEWVYEPEPTQERWRIILAQDFGNMGAVQKGIKSRGYKGARPSPVQEEAVIHFHRTLAKYMGSGMPVPL
jgi:hypothetical protein